MEKAMSIRNRMADVDVLRNKVCQAYLKLIIVPDWQEKLYKIAEAHITGKFKGSYMPIYKKMREVGTDNYSVDYMDISAMSVVVLHNPQLAPSNDNIRKAFDVLRKWRNDAGGHLNGNEKDEDLYLDAMMVVRSIETFIDTVHDQAIIPEDRKLAFYQEYLKKSKELMRTLDDERFKLMSTRKEIEKDLAGVLKSDDKQKTWYKIWKKYKDRQHTEFELYGTTAQESLEQKLFYIMSAEAGIIGAYETAGRYYLDDKDYLNAAKYYELACENWDGKGVIWSFIILAWIYIFYIPDQKERGNSIIDELNGKRFQVEVLEDVRDISWLENNEIVRLSYLGVTKGHK